MASPLPRGARTPLASMSSAAQVAFTALAAVGRNITVKMICRFFCRFMLAMATPSPPPHPPPPPSQSLSCSPPDKVNRYTLHVEPISPSSHSRRWRRSWRGSRARRSAAPAQPCASPTRPRPRALFPRLAHLATTRSPMGYCDSRQIFKLL